MTDAGSAQDGSPIQRLVALVILAAAGIVSLPLSAYFVDEVSENLILPAALGGMVLLGAVVGALLPGLARAGSSRARAARVGAIIGVVVTIVGTLIFFLMLSGFDGA